MKILKKAILVGLLLVSCNSFADLNTGLVGYWNFDDCNANDSSGNGYNGSIQGNPQCVDGIKGKAFSFNGDSINISENLKTDYFSFSGWFKTSSTGGDYNGNMIIRLRYWGYSITVDYAKLGAWVAKSNNSSYWFSPEKSIADDKYHHVVLSYGATTGYNLYLDGVLISSQNTGNNPPIYFTSGGGYSFGKDGNYPGHYFKGILDEFRIYNRALTNIEAKELYNQGKEPSIVVGTNIWQVKEPYAAQCKNNSTKQIVTNNRYKNLTYNCEEMGVKIQAGDDVTVAVKAKVQSTDAGLSHEKVNGHVTWAKYPYYVECLNKTTNQKITFSSNEQNYDCEEAGLSVIGNNIVRIQVRGTVDDSYSIGQKALWNQLVSTAETGDILFFNHEHDCSGDGCYFETGTYALGEAYGFFSHAALIESIDKNTQTITLFQATNPNDTFNNQVSVSNKISLDDLHAMYPRGSIVLSSVNNASIDEKNKAMDDGKKKYNRYGYISLSNLALGHIGRLTYCSKLVKDVWANQGVILNDADTYSGGSLVKFAFTPDELANSTNIKKLLGMVF